MLNCKDKIVIVCSGGGLRAVESQAGMIDAMLDFGIVPEFGYGSSGGALTVGLHFSEVKIRDFLSSIDIDEAIKMRNWISSYILGKSIYDNSGMLKYLETAISPVNLKNVIVNVTNLKTEETVYLPGNLHSIFTSASIPVVFPEQTVCSGRAYTKIIDNVRGKPVTCKKESYCDFPFKAGDGGVFDLIPVPELEEIEANEHIYVLVCNDDTKTEASHLKTKVGKALHWIMGTMDREYRQIVNDLGTNPKVTILKPPPFRSSLLNFSPGLYEHCYKYMKEILEKRNENPNPVDD